MHQVNVYYKKLKLKEEMQKEMDLKKNQSKTEASTIRELDEITNQYLETVDYNKNK